MRALGFMRGRPRNWLSRQRFFTVLRERFLRWMLLNRMTGLRRFLSVPNTIVRHENVWNGGNEGERRQIVRTTLFFSFFKSKTRLCNIFLFCGGKPGNVVILERGCCQRDSDASSCPWMLVTVLYVRV